MGEFLQSTIVPAFMRFVNTRGVRAIKDGMMFSMPAIMVGAVYLLLSLRQPGGLHVVCLSVVAEQTAFGFGFAAYLWLLRHIAWREYGKSLMALSLLLSGVCAGALQEAVGYANFFALTFALGALTLLSAGLLRKIPTKK